MTTKEQVSRLSAKTFGSRWAPDRFLADFGLGLTRMRDTCEFDFRHEQSGIRVELKAARYNRSGSFIFQYIRPDCFDLCVCLGWREDAYNYWIFDITKIRPFLARQHRASNSFQLRLRPEHGPFRRLAVSPSYLRLELDRKVRAAVRHRRLVRIDPILASVEGWQAVASSISRQIKQCGLSDWQFVLRPLCEQINNDDYSDSDDLQSYQFFEAEKRVELQLHPRPLLNTNEVKMTAGCLFGLLIQFLDTDELNGDGTV